MVHMAALTLSQSSKTCRFMVGYELNVSLNGCLCLCVCPVMKAIPFIKLPISPQGEYL